MATWRTAMSDPVFDAVIIGCGAIAGGYDAADPASDTVLTHAKAYESHAGFRLVACVDPNAEQRQAFQQRWNIPHGFDHLAAVDVPFDVASVCAITDVHADVLEQLLTRPLRAVWAEKPITSDVDSAARLVAAYEQAGIPLCVNHLRRWAPGIVALRDEIASGQWGLLQGGTGLYTKGLLNNGSHMLDVVDFLLGPVVPVAHLWDAADGRDQDKTSDVVVQVGDARLTLMGADGTHYSVFELDLLFAQGRVCLVESAFQVVRRPVVPSPQFPGYQILAPAQTQPTGLGRAMLAGLDNLYRHLTQGEALLSSGHTALAAQRACAALAGLPAAFPRS